MKVERGEALFGTGKEDSGEREREAAIAQYFYFWFFMVRAFFIVGYVWLFMVRPNL